MPMWCSSHFDCVRVEEYCDLVIGVCDKCSWLCHPSRILLHNCLDLCQGYLSLNAATTPQVTVTTRTSVGIDDKVMMSNMDDTFDVVLLTVLVIGLIVIIISGLSAFGIMKAINFKRKKHWRKRSIQMKTQTVSTMSTTIPKTRLEYQHQQNGLGRCERHALINTMTSTQNQHNTEAVISAIDPDLILNNEIFGHKSRSKEHSQNEEDSDSGYTEPEYIETLLSNKTQCMNTYETPLLSAIPVDSSNVVKHEYETKSKHISSGSQTSGFSQVESQIPSCNRDRDQPLFEISDNLKDPDKLLPVIDTLLEKEAAEPVVLKTDQVSETLRSNRPIYDVLRRLSYVEGYYSEGKSIQVFVDLGVMKEDWVMNQLVNQTGQSSEKFHICQNIELD